MAPTRTTPAADLDRRTVTDLLATQRARNARTISITVVVLDLATVAIVAAILPNAWVLLSLGFITLVSTVAAAAILRGHMQTGVLTLIFGQLAGQAGVTVALGEVAILPLFGGVVVLIAASTLPSPRIAWVSALALITIGIEMAIGIRSGGTREMMLGPVTGGVVLTITTAVISFLQVRGMERAMDLAAERGRLLERATQEAQISETRHRLIADNTNDLILLVDQSAHAEYLSPSYQRCLGHAPSTLSPANVLESVHGDDRDAFLLSLQRARTRGHETSSVRFRTADGKHVTYEAQFNRVTIDQRELVAVIGRDVTLRLALEDQVRKSQRMEALDRLAGGIAHDFNNLLGVAIGTLDLFQRDRQTTQEGKEDLAIIQRALDSAKGLTQQLLAFSRKQVATPQVLDLAETIRGIADMLQRLVGKDVKLELDLSPDGPCVRAPQSQIEQIAMNLAANARDAMPGGGKLRLVLRPRQIATDEVAGLGPGSYVDFAATDTGVGIAPHVLPHLFEPFFTTKPEGRGLGLGLATCYGIARQCGGTILVETALNVGSTFRVLLPAAEAVPTCIQDERTPPPASAGQRVLLVDDDPSIIKLVERMLTAAGFEVVTASTLNDAERAITRTPRPFDVLVTDIVLGEDRGTTLLPRVRDLWPSIRIVVLSGYAPEPETIANFLGRRGTFLSKPFSRRSLLAAVGLPDG